LAERMTTELQHHQSALQHAPSGLHDSNISVGRHSTALREHEPDCITLDGTPGHAVHLNGARGLHVQGSGLLASPTLSRATSRWSLDTDQDLRSAWMANHEGRDATARDHAAALHVETGTLHVLQSTFLQHGLPSCSNIQLTQACTNVAYSKNAGVLYPIFHVWPSLLMVICSNKKF